MQRTTLARRFQKGQSLLPCDSDDDDDDHDAKRNAAMLRKQEAFHRKAYFGFLLLVVSNVLFYSYSFQPSHKASHDGDLHRFRRNIRHHDSKPVTVTVAPPVVAAAAVVPVQTVVAADVARARVASVAAAAVQAAAHVAPVPAQVAAVAPVAVASAPPVQVPAAVAVAPARVGAHVSSNQAIAVARVQAAAAAARAQAAAAVAVDVAPVPARAQIVAVAPSAAAAAAAPAVAPAHPVTVTTTDTTGTDDNKVVIPFEPLNCHHFVNQVADGTYPLNVHDPNHKHGQLTRITKTGHPFRISLHSESFDKRKWAIMKTGRYAKVDLERVWTNIFKKAAPGARVLDVGYVQVLRVH
jgi:hypothetical protein